MSSVSRLRSCWFSMRLSFDRRNLGICLPSPKPAGAVDQLREGRGHIPVGRTNRARGGGSSVK
eukprot:978384-Prorocentrum_minimum.AAC.1